MGIGSPRSFVLRCAAFGAVTIVVAGMGHLLFPRHWGDPVLGAKIDAAVGHDPIFVGSSRIFRQFDPWLFDSCMARRRPQQEWSAFDLGRVVVSKTHKLVYNATYHLPYHGVDFGSSEMFREVRELAQAKKLPDPLNALYDGRPRAMIEVFDLARDPSEFDNLAGKPEAAEVEQELRAALLEWMILERDFLPLPVTSPRPKK